VGTGSATEYAPLVAAATGARKRRRRAPEEARREILDAAERLIKGGSPQDLSVTAVMDGTTLTRNAFYVYFANRYALVAALVDRLRAEADRAMDAFTGGMGDPSEGGRRAIETAARLYADHGELLRALAEAAERDPAAARAWRAFTEPSHRILTRWVREEMRAGRVHGIDPEPVVRALVAMNRACFFEQLVGKPNPDVEGVARMLQTIWTRTLYGPGGLPAQP
jgi:AcrR family transcriptional regulator